MLNETMPSSDGRRGMSLRRTVGAWDGADEPQGWVLRVSVAKTYRFDRLSDDAVSVAKRHPHDQGALRYWVVIVLRQRFPRLATSVPINAVHPVWCDAPSPSPVSPSKYS